MLPHIQYALRIQQEVNYFIIETITKILLWSPSVNPLSFKFSSDVNYLLITVSSSYITTVLRICHLAMGVRWGNYCLFE